jgi:outer membrane protein assembly factor BamB
MNKLNNWVKANLLVGIIVFLLTGCMQKEATRYDWPQFKNDNFRSGSSMVELNLEKLEKSWVYTANQEPVPAWYGPAKEDAYARSGPLPSMRDYDLAYYPVVVGNNLYYASSADDAVHCLNAENGDEKWRFTTGGPVRIAPSFHKGNLYFGSDDGYVYCISARSGKLKWKYSPVPEQERWVLHNSRLVSFWPIRTGVLVEDDIVYFGASLLPWKKTWFCAIDRRNGKPEGDGTFVKEMDNMTLEGAMASTGTKLIQPQGRIAPVFFDKSNGDNLGSLPGTGGCFVLVTPEKHVVHPQTSRHKSIKEYVDEQEPEYMSFKGGKEMVIKGDTSFILSDNSLSAYHRQTQKLLWLRRDYQGHRLIQSGGALYVGATDTVYAVSPYNGLPLWKGHVDGTVYALATANEALYVSTNAGKIYRFAEGEGNNPLYLKNKDKAPVVAEKASDERPEINVNPLELMAGPSIVALSNDSVLLTFAMPEKTAVQVEWGVAGLKAETYQLTAANQHEIRLPIRKDFIYTYKLSTADGRSVNHEYDNFFNYTETIIRDIDWGTIDATTTKEVTSVLEATKENSGLAIVIGMANESLPLELARQTNLKIIVLCSDQKQVDKWRDKWQTIGVYGQKLNLKRVDDLTHLPVASELANLVWLNSETDATDEAIRLTVPNGNAIVANKVADNLKNSELAWQVEPGVKLSTLSILQKQPFEIAGDWTHQYAQPDNSAFGGESFWGSTKAKDFEIQWMGRPGPRFQTDRSGRKPSPLAVSGRLFVQGNERVVAVNVYNGQVLWSRDFPGFKRMNVNRDCSNWAADSDYLYLLIHHNLIKVNQLTGDIEATLPINNENSDWGYIALEDDKLIGSTVTKGASYTDYYGGSGWYDAKSGGSTHKVMSHDIFAKDTNGETLLWRYQPNGYIVNPTISHYKDRIYFVESSSVKLSDFGRGGDDLFKSLWLVALNKDNGQRLWRRKLQQRPGITMYSMAAGTGKLVIVSSNDWKYNIYSYDAEDGTLIWEQEQPWFHGDHGGHLSRPAIVNNRLVVKPVVYNLATGETESINIPKSGHGCATYALTEQSIFYRGGSVTQFNFDTREFSRWERLRPDCWLSTIPAQGMVLSPEAGGGCSCGNWLETSMVMAPVSRAPITINTIDENKPDYKQETYGEYTQSYEADEFLDSLLVTIHMKPGLKGTVRYTLDGSTPDDNSLVYSQPILLTQNTEVKAAVFVEKEGQLRKYTRARSFTRLRPAPSIERQSEVKDGNVEVTFSKITKTGTIYYTTDGTEPDQKGHIGAVPLVMSGKKTIKACTIWEEEGKEFRSEVVSKEVEVPVLKKSVEPTVQQGVRYEYYEGRWKELPDFEALKPEKSGNHNAFNLEIRQRDHWYAIRFKAYVSIPVDGFYSFYTTSDDASAIYLHNELLVDNNGSHGERERHNEIALEAGYHPITVVYYQNNKDQVLKVEIAGPGMEKQEITPDKLRVFKSNQ